MAPRLLLVPFLALATLGAQTPAAGPPATPVAKPAAPVAMSPDEMVAMRATPYAPTLRRDPFSAPSDEDQSTRGDLLDDIALKGRVTSRGQVFAVISDSRGATRKIAVGYKFRDGELVAIGETTMTFRQWDESTGNQKMFRTVVKTFKREEAKR